MRDSIFVMFYMTSNDMVDSIRFHYMALADRRQRVMPTEYDRITGRALAYKEAVLLTNPSNSNLKGEVGAPI